jgi:hypothetical protein
MQHLATLGIVLQIASFLGLLYGWIAAMRAYTLAQRTNRALLNEKAMLMDQLDQLKSRCATQSKVLATATRIVEVRTKEAEEASGDHGEDASPPEVASPLPTHRKRRKKVQKTRTVRESL